MLGAGEDGQAFGDVGGDGGELPRGVAVAEIRAPAGQDAIEVADNPRQGVAHEPAIGRRPDLAPDGVHRPIGWPRCRSQRPRHRPDSTLWWWKPRKSNPCRPLDRQTT